MEPGTLILIGLSLVIFLFAMTSRRSYPPYHDEELHHPGTRIVIYPGHRKPNWDEYNNTVRSLDRYVLLIVLFVLALIGLFQLL